MRDLSTAVKAGILAALDVAVPVTELVPAAQIFPRKVEADPRLPFMRYEGNPAPYETTCGQGSEVAVRLHAFAEGETTCERISAAVTAAMSDITAFQSCDWVRTQYLMDDAEADIWHAIIDFTVIHTV